MFTPFKPMVVFYEKRGCSGNKRQQELLQKHGITLEIRSLLDTPWSIETLQRVETYKGTFFPMRFKSSLNPS